MTRVRLLVRLVRSDCNSGDGTFFTGVGAIRAEARYFATLAATDALECQ